MRILGLSLRGVCVASVVAVLASAGTASAQTGQGQYITQASERLGKLISKGNEDGFILDNNKFSIGGGWLKQGTDNWVALYTVTLEKGKQYRLIAAGDNDAKDVDLEVKDASGKVLASDTSTDPEAIVNFTPDTTGRYLIRLRLYASRNDLPCVCLAIVLARK